MSSRDSLGHTVAAVSRLFRTATRQSGCWPLTKRGIALATMFLIPSPGLAQDDLHNWSALDASKFKTVFVLDESGQETSGRLVELNADSLLLQIQGREQRFEATRVRRLAKRGDSLKNGALLGAVIGAVVGVASSGSSGCTGTTLDAQAPCGAGARVLGALVGGAVFAGVGVGIDALIPGRTTLYEAPGWHAGLSTDSHPHHRPTTRLSGLRLNLQW